MTGSAPAAVPQPDDAERPPAGRSRWRRARDQLIAFGWLIVVWCLLWGEVSWGNVFGGALVGLAVLVFFPLPRVTFDGRIRPLALADFVLRFLAELVTASMHVAWIAIRPGYQPRNAIIAVRLRIRTDLNLTLTAEVLSLVPGTLIVEADRAAGTLYVHLLDVRGPDDVTGSRERVLALEARLVRAFGSPAEVRQLSAAIRQEGS